MIAGIVESVTPCGVGGWVWLRPGLGAPLILRARDGDKELASIEIELGSPSRPLGRPAAGERRAFRLDFPRRLERTGQDRVVVEAKATSDPTWRKIPRRLRVYGTYLDLHPPLPIIPDYLPDPNAHAPMAAAPGFWSDDLAASANLEARPLFVVGSVRSGTTAVCQALVNGTRYKGFPEGHVLDLAIRLIGALHVHFDFKERWIPSEISAHYHCGRFGRSYFTKEIIALLRRTAAGYKTPFWYDKTPTYQMVGSVPYLAEAFPKGCFLFMKRRGLETLASRMRRFPTSGFEDICRDWTLIMAGWRAVRATVQGRCLEIDQLDMKREPEATAVRIGSLLSCDAAETAALAIALRDARPEVTDPSSTVIGDLSSLHWTEQQIEHFRTTCGSEMEAYGYTYDARYRFTPTPENRCDL